LVRRVHVGGEEVLMADYERLEDRLSTGRAERSVRVSSKRNALLVATTVLAVAVTLLSLFAVVTWPIALLAWLLVGAVVFAALLRSGGETAAETRRRGESAATSR
jgi:hypothetical protein